VSVTQEDGQWKDVSRKKYDAQQRKRDVGQIKGNLRELIKISKQKMNLTNKLKNGNYSENVLTV
jgi:hypothetical protein